MTFLLNMFDNPALHAVVLPALAERVAQEEVWAQTIWPEGEPSLTDHITDNIGGLAFDLGRMVEDLLVRWQEA